MCSLRCGQKGEGGPVGGCHPSLALGLLPGRLWTRGREIAVLNRDRQRAGRDLGGCSPLICHHQAQRRQATWGHGQQVCVGTRPAGFALPFPSKFADGPLRPPLASPTPVSLSWFLRPSRAWCLRQQGCCQKVKIRVGQRLPPSFLHSVPFLLSLLKVPGPVPPPAHTPEMESLLIGSALARLTAEGLGLLFLFTSSELIRV